MGFLQILTYLSGLVFVIAFAAKISKYATMPMHVRWELYPIPHEGQAWGGSFLRGSRSLEKDTSQRSHGPIQVLWYRKFFL